MVRRTRIDDDYERAERMEDDFYAPEMDDSGNVYRKKRQKGGSY